MSIPTVGVSSGASAVKSSSDPLSKPTLIRSNESEVKMASGEWMLVRRVENDGLGVGVKSDAEQTLVVPTAKLSKVVSRTSRLSARPKGKYGEMKTVVAVQIAATSAANTALTAVVGLTPTSSTEWSSFQALYDEYKVTGIQFPYVASSNATGTSPQLLVMAYDPEDTAALSSVAAGCEFQQHDLTLLVGNNSTFDTPIQAMSRSGLHHWKMVPPQRGFISNPAVATNVVGGWSATSNTDTVGYLKPFAPAMGAGVASNYIGIAMYEVTFRNRQ